jgi:hypothetical protein
MVGINDIRMDIINRIARIGNLDKLMAISKNVQEIENTVIPVKTKPRQVKKTLPLSEAKTGIRKNVTFEQILEEQKYKKGLRFEDFKELQDDPDWECTLDELLAALD